MGANITISLCIAIQKRQIFNNYLRFLIKYLAVKKEKKVLVATRAITINAISWYEITIGKERLDPGSVNKWYLICSQQIRVPRNIPSKRPSDEISIPS